MNESIRSAPIRSSPTKMSVHPYDLKNTSLTVHQHVVTTTTKKVPQLHTSSLDRSIAMQDELEYYRNRCHELELQLQASNGIDIHRSMLGESQLQSFVRENTSLHVDNEKLLKIAQQRKTEAELWKQKYENQLQQVIQIKANYELEIRQLTTEVSKLVARVEEYEFDKQKQIIDATAKIDDHSNKQMDHLRKSHSQQSDLLQHQVRQLREQIEDQNMEIDALQAKLLRQKNDDDEEMKRLHKDNESLRSRINQLEIERQEEIESLAQNLSDFQKQQLITLKQAHTSQNDVIEGEVAKLRGLLDVKNTEIETLLQQNQRNKAVLKEESEQLRAELTLLKQKLLEQERSARRNLEVLQEQLNAVHDENVMYLKHNYENQITILEREVNDLKRALDKKSLELQVLIDEKTQLRDFLESQILGLRRELDEAKIHSLEIEREKNREIDDLQEQFQRAQAMASEHSDQNVGQIKFLEGEISRLKELLTQKSKDLESHINQSMIQKRSVEEELRRVKSDLDRTKDALQMLEHTKNSEIEELRLRNSKLEALYRDKSRNADATTEHHALEIRRLKEQLEVKSQEIDNLLVQRSGFERECRRIKDENEDLKTKLIQSERERLQSHDELKIKLESSSQFEVNQLKAAFNTQLRVLQDENLTLKQSLDNRDKDITDLLQKCDQMSKSFEQGILPPELATNQRICEILLKSKSQRSSIQRSL